MATQYWDRNVADVESKTLKGWLDWEFIEREYIRPAVSGDSDVYYLDHFFRMHLPQRPAACALSLGCGGGNLERALIDLNAATTIDACDFSPESIRLARQLAEEKGVADRIHYDVCDINQLALARGKYDFVIAKMALHHFERLEHVFEQVRLSLKPGGVFVFNEYVGPSRFQWTEVQLELMNALLDVLPDRNRRSSVNNDFLRRIDRPTVEGMLHMDPSEAVRSAEILPALRKAFEIVEYKPYGGTLLHILLTHVMATFDLRNEEQRSLLKMLFLLEKTLIGHGVLGSDFAYGVARPLAVPSDVPPPMAQPLPAASLVLAQRINGHHGLRSLAGRVLRRADRTARNYLRPVKRMAVNWLDTMRHPKVPANGNGHAPVVIGPVVVPLPAAPAANGHAATNPVAAASALPPLPSKEEMYEYLVSFDYFSRQGIAEAGENYAKFHLQRFFRSMQLMPRLQGPVQALELGASPYFMTVMLEKYLGYQVTAANFTGDYGETITTPEDEITLTSARYKESYHYRYKIFNAERDAYPYPDHSFDVVVCCEMIEHLPMDPSHLLYQTHRVLKPGGYLFMTTPNALRWFNVFQLMSGRNIYGAYSTDGVYGRHNREYAPQELRDLLKAHNFEPTLTIDDAFPREAFYDDFYKWFTWQEQNEARKDYLFAVAQAHSESVRVYPSWLYVGYKPRPGQA